MLISLLLKVFSLSRFNAALAWPFSVKGMALRISVVNSECLIAVLQMCPKFPPGLYFPHSLFISLSMFCLPLASSCCHGNNTLPELITEQTANCKVGCGEECSFSYWMQQWIGGKWWRPHPVWFGPAFLKFLTFIGPSLFALYKA